MAEFQRFLFLKSDNSAHVCAKTHFSAIREQKGGLRLDSCKPPIKSQIAIREQKGASRKPNRKPQVQKPQVEKRKQIDNHQNHAIATNRRNGHDQINKSESAVGVPQGLGEQQVFHFSPFCA